MSDPTQERWLPVVGYEGLYEVSDQGRVRSLPREVWTARGTGYFHPVAGRILKTPIGSTGYPKATLYRGAIKRSFSLHTLVARAFLGIQPAGFDVCHSDGNPLNNSLSNLRYDSRVENQLDIVRHGRNSCLNRSHCPSGHPYSGDNLILHIRPGKNPSRECRTCKRSRDRARYKAQRKLPAP